MLTLYDLQFTLKFILSIFKISVFGEEERETKKKKTFQCCWWKSSVLFCESYETQ